MEIGFSVEDFSSGQSWSCRVGFAGFGVTLGGTSCFRSLFSFFFLSFRSTNRGGKAHIIKSALIPLPVDKVGKFSLSTRQQHSTAGEPRQRMCPKVVASPKILLSNLWAGPQKPKESHSAFPQHEISYPSIVSHYLSRDSGLFS